MNAVLQLVREARQQVPLGAAFGVQGVYVGRGLVRSGDGARPRLPTLEAAKAFVLARQLEAQATLERIRAPGPRPDDGAS